MKRLVLAAIVLLGACSPEPQDYKRMALHDDRLRLERLDHHVAELSAEQRRVMAKYAAAANAYKPGSADDLKAALIDTRYTAYSAQLDMVHEFTVVQDALRSDMAFNSKPAVIALQSEMQGTTIALAEARDEYNFAAAIYLDRLNTMKPEERAKLPSADLVAPTNITWFSDHNGSESARAAVVFDDDGD